MSTPPRPTDAELAERIATMYRRHAKVDDPHLDRWSDDPRDVLDYLTRFGTTVPRWVRQADAYDTLVLLTWSWWQERRRERSALHRALDLGLPRSQIGQALGMTSRQGVRDRVDRLDALLRHDRPDEKLTRAARAAARHTDEADELRWLQANADTIRSTAVALIHKAQIVEFDDADRAWLEELERDIAAPPPYSAATLIILGLAAQEVRTHPYVLNLAAAHPLHRIIRRIDQLRTEWATK